MPKTLTVWNVASFKFVWVLNPYYFRAVQKDSALRVIFYLILDDILVLLLDFHYQIHDTSQFFLFFEISDFCHFCDFKMRQQSSYPKSIGVQTITFLQERTKS